MIKEFIQKNGEKLKLTKAAIVHITQGNFSIRPVRNQDNMTVISGGLHTYDAWIEFRKKHSNKLEHLHFFNSNKHQYWYYARELGNGVITLKIPRELFTGKAARITMYPDEYYKSGFLWKTLFPKGYDEVKIVSLIGETLENEDEGQTQPGQIIGYINNGDPLLKIKVVIQHHGNEIKSVFPAWTQPNSGNNGKPYSYYENIGFVIAQSTEYFDDKEKLDTSAVYNFSEQYITAEELHLYTPLIFATRKIPTIGESPNERDKKRKEELESYTISEKENDIIFNYLNDFTLVKFYPELLFGVYKNASHILSEDQSFFNTFQIVQNFVDGLNYLHLTDQKKRLIETITFMLNNMVSYTMLDLLSKKRITSTMIQIVEAANIPELSHKFLISLSTSPVRREAYLEYNLDSLSKKKLNEKLPLEDFPDELHIIMNPSLDMSIEREDFIEILKELLGETYTLSFKDDELNSFIDDLITNQSENYDILVKDNLTQLTPNSFLSLSTSIGTILDSASKYNNGNTEQLITCVGLILRDYCKIQFAHRQRINVRYFKYHNFTKDFYLPIDYDLLFGIVLKHERLINFIKLGELTKSIIEFAKNISSKKLEKDANKFMEKIGKERPPLPERYQ
ncbi:hypothetical protein [Psychrobacter glaciei]|uniref:hypothetical protein n=1 Tax=Psychrobacter TaxID=497 RepID=UPI001F059B50|nr:hypothetical protein [Psychrobacter glaciei]MCH1783124.1 hypothetical protein [Psychrobacter glaciei]